MTGFKRGAAASGFDDEESTADASEPEEAQNEAENTGADGPSTDARPSGTDAETSEPSAADQGAGAGQLPWIYRRDNARDGRPRTKQIHLQPSTAEREGVFRSEVESVLGESVNLTDLREASLLVAMDHVDEVTDQLREWGYDFD